MKTFKLLAVAGVSLMLLVGLTSIALSAPETVTPSKTGIQQNVSQSAAPIVTPCPTGWHLKSGSLGKAFTCVPNKPSPLKCSPGFYYVDNTESGCFIGCQEIVK